MLDAQGAVILSAAFAVFMTALVAGAAAAQHLRDLREAKTGDFLLEDKA